MANVDTKLILRKTLDHFKKTDSDIHGMLARSTVVWVQRWQADEHASPERVKAGAGEWVTVVEGPLFVLSRQTMPFYQMIVRPRSPSQQPIKLAVTDKVGFVPKKPNLHLMEDDSKETAVYNFHFPGDPEGSESFDRMLHVLQCVVSGAAHTLVPLAQMGLDVAPNIAAQNRMIKVDDLFMVMGSPSMADVQHASPASHAQHASTDEVTANGPKFGSVPAQTLQDDGTPTEATVTCDAQATKPESSSPLTASKLLAKLHPKVQAAQLAHAPEAPGDFSTATVGPGVAEQRMRNVPPPPPPDVEKPFAPPDIIAQLFGSTSGAPSVSVQKSAQDDDTASTHRNPSHMRAAAVTVSDQHCELNGSSTATLPDHKHHASVKKLFQILLQDERFIDAVADAMSTMTTG